MAKPYLTDYTSRPIAVAAYLTWLRDAEARLRQRPTPKCPTPEPGRASKRRGLYDSI